MPITNSPKEGASEGKSGCELSVLKKRAGSVIFFYKIMKIRIEIEGKNPASIKYQGPDSAEMAIKYLGIIEADEIQVEVQKDGGNRSEGEFKGKNWFDLAVKFIKTAAGINPSVNSHIDSFAKVEKLPEKSLTLKNQIHQFLKYEYQTAWFSSIDVRNRYEKVHGEISLGTVSTYLARMYNENLLERKGNRNHREYRLIDSRMTVGMKLAAIE